MWGQLGPTLQLILPHKVTSRSRHIARRHLKVREYVADGILAVSHVPTLENAADIFTKPLEAVAFNKHRAFLMSREICE
eukprot:scaffold4142_cov118-Isochrysis_galbana.AAC.6